ncbi:hypothetical protein [Wenxinia marina]|uniref:Ceramidase n=1 Tax=Wenxinia marina DSM 24838 TaxID=1123501 RepID=A0A0D0Q7A1_9RHOB|nr:hypothetical protein [Wenxinia marina]KIQ68347.1 hypothetical protein Wenmar_02994 [Wenxinia marina DSM 24838]GGL72900.1 membrane protein [Wenxinia marina]
MDPTFGYCERIDPDLWAEPLNAVTNVAFLLAAWITWARAVDRTGRALALALLAIGVASGLWHTLARGWAGVLDTLTILAFAAIYLHAAVRDFLGRGGTAGLVIAAFYLGFAVIGGHQLQVAAPALGANAFYIAIAILIGAWGVALVRPAPPLGWGLIAAAALLGVSITVRALDAPLCDRLPQGTHWLWHLLNAIVLGWMAELRRPYAPRLEGGGRGR